MISTTMPPIIPPRSADTAAEAEQVQIALIRRVPVSRRLHMAWSLSATVISAARQALLRAQPDASPQDIDLRFVALHYGPELAAAVRAELVRRQAPATHHAMTEADLIAALRPVVEALDALGVRYFLGGSVASSAHGVARASLDADVIAELDLPHVEPLAHRLTGLTTCRSNKCERQRLSGAHLT
jgi:hypothetical protein